MAITKQENVDVCKDKVFFTFEKETVQNVIDTVAKEICKTAKFPGFRQGKATAEVAKVLAKDAVLKYAKQQLEKEAYDEILYETKWKPSISPQVLDSKITMNSFSTEMVVAYTPTFDLKQHKDFEVFEPSNIPSKDKVVDKIIEEITVENGMDSPFGADDFALAGDKIIVNIIAKENGEEIPDTKADGIMITVGDTQTIPGFDDKIIGIKLGEERAFQLEVPSDWDRKQIAGKTVDFTVVMMNGARRIPAVFDTTLAETLKIESFDKLQEAIDKQADAFITNARFIALKNQVIDLLLAANEVDVPEWLVIENAKKICEVQKIQWAMLEAENKASILEISRNNLKFNFLVDKIKTVEIEAELSTEEAYNALNQNLPYLNPDIQKALSQGKDLALLQKALQDIRTEWVLKWVVNHSIVKPLPTEKDAVATDDVAVAAVDAIEPATVVVAAAQQ